MPIVIASQVERLEAGVAYIGEPAEHLTLADDPNRCYGNRTVDFLFHSLVEHAGARSIGIILSGFLDDGSRGLAAIHHTGGLTMVIRPSGVRTAGMPENAVTYDGQIDFIGSPEEIARAITAAIAYP